MADELKNQLVEIIARTIAGDDWRKGYVQYGYGPLEPADNLNNRFRYYAEKVFKVLQPYFWVTIEHTDDFHVGLFAQAMREKLAKKREEGRGGWDDPTVCSNSFLSQLLRDHVDKGDPVDVANLAMMIHQRGETIEKEEAQFNNHPDPLIDAQIEISYLEGLLQQARAGLVRALDLNVVTPNGLSVKDDVRTALEQTEYKGNHHDRLQ